MSVEGILLRRERLHLGWSQEGLCKGICAVSYLSKIEQGRAAASEEIVRQLFARIGITWQGVPQMLAPLRAQVEAALRQQLTEFYVKYSDPGLDGSREAVYGKGQTQRVGVQAGGKPSFRPPKTEVLV